MNPKFFIDELPTEIKQDFPFPFLHYLLVEEGNEGSMSSKMQPTSEIKSSFYNTTKTVSVKYYKPISKIF